MKKFFDPNGTSFYAYMVAIFNQPGALFWLFVMVACLIGALVTK